MAYERFEIGIIKGYTGDVKKDDVIEALSNNLKYEVEIIDDKISIIDNWTSFGNRFSTISKLFPDVIFVIDNFEYDGHFRFYWKNGYYHKAQRIWSEFVEDYLEEWK